MKNLIKYIFAFVFIAAQTSCSDEGFEDYTIEKSSVVEMSGDWYVQTFVDGSLAIDYGRITTSNTSTDGNLQIFDHENIYTFNFSTPVNVNELTFAGVDLESNFEGYEITTTVTNGIIVKNGTVSTSGRTSDSISFDIEFSDDPGTIYHIEGYKRTGFLEDEH